MRTIYSWIARGSPPFVDFPPTLRKLMEGHFGYIDGGYEGKTSIVKFTKAFGFDPPGGKLCGNSLLNH
jgi:hypothetical protein